MLKYLITAALILLPGVLAVFLDCRFSKSHKNLFSKYCFYSLLINMTMLAVAFLRSLAGSTVLAMFLVPSMAVFFGAVSVASAVIWAVIVRKRLPEVLTRAYEYVMSREVAFSVLVILCGVGFFSLRLLVGKNIEVFSNFALMVCCFIALAVPIAVLCAYKVIKMSKSVGSKKAFAAVKSGFKQEDAVAFGKRTGIAALVNFAFAFSVMLFVPYETYLGNAGEFVFGFSSFWWIVAVEALLYFLLLFVLETVFSGKAFNAVVSLVFGVTLAAYVQSMFLNGTMSQMDGNGDTRSVPMLIINAAIWCAVAIIPVLLSVIGVKFWKAVCTFGCILIVGMQAVALVSLSVSVEQPSVQTRITTKGLYDVAEDGNVIVFVLDCYDNDNIDKMLEVEPDILDGLHGFTGYDNVTGSYCYTHIAVPYLLTGEKIPQYDPTQAQFENAINTSKYYNTIADSVSSIGVYTDEFCLRGNTARGKIDNLGSSEGSKLSVDTTLYAAQKASIYRVAPFYFKRFFNYTSENFNSAVKSSGNGDEFYLVAGSTDAAIKINLEKNGLSINPDYTDGCYRFIHTNGAHTPNHLDKNGNYSADITDNISASLGSMKMVLAYLEELQEIGCYEDATIIITSDHGLTSLRKDADDESDVSVNPIMFYKPQGAGWDEPFKRSSAPVSHDDVFPTVMDAFGFEYESENGIDLDEITEDTERTRYFYWNRQEPDMPVTLGNYKHVEYAITGDANDSANWQKTGNEAHCNSWLEQFGGK